MKIKSIITALSVIALIASWGSKVIAADNQNIVPVRDLLEQFLKSEFNGNESTWCDYARLTPQRIALEKKEHHDMVDCVINELPYVKLILVKSYKIDKIILVNAKLAKATVVYSKVAKTVGNDFFNRKIIPDIQTNDVINLNIEKVKNNWRVVDPEIPRVSVKAVINSYEDLLKNRDDKWLSRQDITTEQIKYYDTYKSTYETLKKIDSL